MPRCAGKIAIVTGAASGIGLAAATLLASEGAKVLLTDIDDERGRRAVSEIGASAEFHALDTSNEDDWKNVIDHCQSSYQRLDILVNNAAVSFISGQQSPEEISIEEWRAVNAINIEGIMLGCKYSIVAMRKSGGGSIVNIASVAGRMASPLALPYGASKAAVIQFTKSISFFCARHGMNIRCNAVLPGIVDTEMYRTFSEEQRAQNIRAVPLGRTGTTEEIARAILFLANDESTYITGVELPVDGGMLAGNMMRLQS